MKTIIANIKHATRNNESVSIGGGIFQADELVKLVKLYEAACLAEEALAFDFGGEPLPTLEKKALEALKEVI